MAKKKENIEEPLEKQLWKAADKLRKNIDAAEYKHVVLGLIFLKYISFSFEELYARLQKEIELGADPEDREEYKAENVFYVPQVARWSNLVSNAKDPKIGKFIDDAMDAIEKENPILKGVLPKVFARPNLDPCCGSGGMFVQSEKFVKEHQGIINDISIYGQESNQTTWRLCKMNLAIRGIDASQVKWNTEGSFLNDAHRDVKVDYVIANPPFNDSDWSGDLLRSDGRWKYGVPPTSNANFAWIQHFIYHLAPNGQAGFVLAKGALTSKSGGEGEIRKELVKAGLVDCIVNLPAKLFLNTQIPASLWFLSRNRNETDRFRERGGEILFIDARNMGHLINRRTREFSAEDIQLIADTYHQWRNKNGNYHDEAGFCASVSIAKVEELDYVLTPGRYVGLPEEEDDFNFEERFAALKSEFAEQLKEEERLNKLILENLEKIKIS